MTVFADLEQEFADAVADFHGPDSTQEQIDRLNRAAEALAAHRASLRSASGPRVGGDAVVTGVDG